MITATITKYERYIVVQVYKGGVAWDGKSFLYENLPENELFLLYGEVVKWLSEHYPECKKVVHTCEISSREGE